MSLYVLSTPEQSNSYQKKLISNYSIISDNVYNTWIPIKLNRYDFKQLLLKSQRQVRYIRNTVQGNSIDLNGYWTIFKVYDSLQREIDISPNQFTLSNNQIPINNTDLSYINQNNMKVSKKVQTIYDNQLIVSPSDENPISLTLDLGTTRDISKILISHIPDKRIFYSNTIEISDDEQHWETIFNNEYEEQYGGKSFYFFDQNNILFLDSDQTIVDINDEPILKSICYQFDIDNNYQFYMVKNETINGKQIVPGHIYMYYSKDKLTYDGVIQDPQQELILDFTNTNYENEIKTVTQRYLKFLLPPEGIKLNEIEVYDIFGINILKNKSVKSYSDNFDTEYIYSLKFITDGVKHTITDYANIGNSKNNDYQYIIYDLGQQYPISSIKIYPLYQNEYELTSDVINNFRCEYSLDNKNYNILYDTNRDGLIYQSPYGTELIKDNIQFDSPLQPLYAQYIKIIYEPFKSIIPFYPQLIKFKNKLFLFTQYNKDYHNITYTENIVFKEILGNYVTINPDIALYNYDQSKQYYLSIIDDTYLPSIKYQLPTIEQITGFNLTKYVDSQNDNSIDTNSGLQNIQISIDDVNYINIYNWNDQYQYPYWVPIPLGNFNVYNVINYGTKDNGIYMSSDSNNSLFTLSTSIRYNNINLFDGKNKLLILDFVPYKNVANIFTFSNNILQLQLSYQEATSSSPEQYSFNISLNDNNIFNIPLPCGYEIYSVIKIYYDTTNNIILDLYITLPIFVKEMNITPIFAYTTINTNVNLSTIQSTYNDAPYLIIGDGTSAENMPTFKLNYLYLLPLKNINDDIQVNTNLVSNISNQDVDAD